MIDICGVNHRFGAHHVLRDLDLAIAEHRIGVIGANGSGKSTFARLLNGLLIPDAGTVTVDGFDTRKDVKTVRRRVGFVFQNPDNIIREIEQPVVLMTHDLDHLRDFDRVIVFDEGRVAADGSPDAAIDAYLRMMAVAADRPGHVPGIAPTGRCEDRNFAGTAARNSLSGRGRE